MAIANRFSSQEAGQEDEKITYVHAKLSIICNAHNIQTPSAGDGTTTGGPQGGTQCGHRSDPQRLTGHGRTKEAWPSRAAVAETHMLPSCSAVTHAQAPAGPTSNGERLLMGSRPPFRLMKTRLSRLW